MCLFVFRYKSGPWFIYFVYLLQENPFNDTDFGLFFFSSFFFFNVSRCPICYWRSVEKELHEEWRDGAKAKQNTQLWMWRDRGKVRCCKEQYYIGTWNVRSMNQGKLEVVKQEMARVNVNILGISELKWTGMGEFNSDDHYVYYCG